MTPRPPDSPWLTKEEAALRARVSPDQIAKAIHDGSLRVRRVGRSVVIHWQWVDDWLMQPQALAS